MNNLHLIVRDQFPEFVREDYPIFVEFVKSYYKWLGQQSIKIEDAVDLDKAPEQFVKYFRSELDAYGLFTDIGELNHLYLQKIKQIYSAKGSEQALVNILKLVYQAESSIRYPSEQILRASDGRWNQERFIVVQQTFGSIPTNFNEFYIKYNLTDVRVKLSKYEVIGEGVARLFFRPTTSISVSTDQLVYVYDSQGLVVYAAKVVRQPAKITIVKGGANWQLGQIIVIPGTVRDTVVRVTEVTPQGAIVSVEIIQYGFDHTENQTLIVSPYPNKPLGSSFDLTVTQTSISPAKYLYSLDINDYLEGAIDRVQGISSGISGSSYFLQDYAEPGYVGYTVFDNSTYNAEYEPGVESDITIEQWLASRATLSYSYDTVVTERGNWKTDAGMLSNENIRLQDNFYYQQFSYDIEANTNSTNYIELARTIHPAGMKLFTTYALGEVLSVQPIAVTSFPFIKLDLFDSSEPFDSNTKLAVKNPTDSITITDFDKQIVTKRPVDSVTIEDIDKQLVTKRTTELLTTTDSDVQTLTKRKEETLTVSETPTKTFNKYLVDSATISSSDISTFEVVQYNVENYFGEGYVRVDKNLTIGV